MGDLRRLAALGMLALGACGDDEIRTLDVDASLDAPLPDAVPDARTDAAAGAPQLSLDQATYTIGPDPVLVSGDTGAALMTLRNDGVGAATDLAFTITPASGEMAILSNCGTTLAPGAACTVSAQLNPSSAGMKMFTVNVASAEGPGDSAMVSGVAGSRVRVVISNLAVGTATIDGRVTSAPAGIDCGAGMTACEMVFTVPGPVVLTATDDGVGTLTEWGVSGCPVTDPCVLDLTRNYTATVAFSAPATVASTSATGTSDEASGVAFDPGANIVLAGRSGTSALLARFDRMGAFQVGSTFGPATRRTLDVSIAIDGVVAAAGEQNGDATLSISPADLLTEPARHVITSAATTDRANGICHDTANNVYMVGDHGDRMSWGRWPAGMSTPTYLLDATTPQGVALGATWDQDVLWIAGALANQTGWLGKVDAATGALTTPTTVAGMMLASSVAAYGMAAGGDLVVAGWTTGNLVVRRYTPALVEVWTRTYPAADGIHPDVAIDAETGAIYVAYDTTTGCTLRKLKGNGSPVWTRDALGTHCEDVAVGVEGAVVAGWTQVGGDRKYFAKKFFH